ncbi:MazG-like protein [Gemella sp. 19428wG2_WT2a]|nr:MazG-like protein [Gemella sp. 19428wG2_WT2a]TFU58021.1 MazG-like protein [Gemella sp. WT2a]
MYMKEIKEKSLRIRDLYHRLEELHHGSKWTVEEDALAFLTDAAIVGRLTMDNQGRWPSNKSDELAYKIGESIWWLVILADRMNLDIEKCIELFLEDKLKKMDNK